MPQKAFQPTDEQRRMVRAMVAYGVPQRDIASVIDVALNTLRKHFVREIETATAEANARIARTLYERAIGGSIRALTFWLERRGGESWKNRATLEHQGFGGQFTIRLGGEDEMPNFIVPDDNPN